MNTDTDLEALIEESGGAWHEDVFHIGGPELMALLRRASLALAPVEAPPEQWLTEAERLIDEYGSARWDMGGCQATFNRLGTKRADEEADEARAALLSHLRLRPTTEGQEQ